MKLKGVIFGNLKVPSKSESGESAQFTSLDFKEVSKLFKIRMYPTDSRTDQTIESPTKTKSLDTLGWVIKCT